MTVYDYDYVYDYVYDMSMCMTSVGKRPREVKACAVSLSLVPASGVLRIRNRRRGRHSRISKTALAVPT